MNNGYVLHTEPNWLSFHTRYHDGGDVCFTRGARGSLVKTTPGALLLFLVSGIRPYKVGGYGWYSRSEITTIEASWRSYGPRLGADSHDATERLNDKWAGRPNAPVAILHVVGFRGLSPAYPLSTLGIAPRPYASRGWHLDDSQTDEAMKVLRISRWSQELEAGELEEEFGDASEEGRRRQQLHLVLERDPGCVAKAKRSWIRKDATLPCEVCGFSFVARFGELGESFIEAHHREPLSQLMLGQVRHTRVADLAPVCANCHRMLHRGGGRTIQELRMLLCRTQ